MRHRITSLLVSASLALCAIAVAPHVNGRIARATDARGTSNACEVHVSLDYAGGLWTLTDVTYALGADGIRVQTYTDVTNADAFVTALRHEFVVC